MLLFNHPYPYVHLLTGHHAVHVDDLLPSGILFSDTSPDVSHDVCHDDDDHQDGWIDRVTYKYEQVDDGLMTFIEVRLRMELITIPS